MVSLRQLLLAGAAILPVMIQPAQAQRVDPGAIVGGILGGIMQLQQQQQQQQQLQQQQRMLEQQRQANQQIEAERQRAAIQAQQEGARQAARLRQQQLAAEKAAAEAKAKAESLNRLRSDPLFMTIVGADNRDLTVLVVGQDTENISHNEKGEAVFPKGASVCLPFGAMSTDPNSIEWRFMASVKKQMEQASNVAGSSIIFTTCSPASFGEYDLIVFSRAQITTGPMEILSPLAEALRKRRFVQLATYSVANFVNPATPVAATTVTQTQVNSEVNNTVVVNLSNDAAELRALITMLGTMIDEQRKMAAGNKGLEDVARESTSRLEARMTDLKARFLDKTTQLSRYRTSIRPNDPDLLITPRKASEVHFKIPYYVPGTPETGEFWLEPVVTDAGELTFNLRFIDPGSENDKTRESIPLSVADVDIVKKALLQVIGWASVAHAKHIRRDYTQRAACFPADKCPAESGPKRDGVASTEIDFKIYEDGSTAARIQRNKGRFVGGYNISIDSAYELQAYFGYVLTEGKTEFEAGSRTDEQMRELFK